MIFPRISIPSPYSPTYKYIREYDKDLAKALDQITTELTNGFEKGIRVDENLDAQIINYTSNGVSNTEDTIAHTLKRVPIGYIVIKQDKAGSFYEGGTAWTTAAIYLKCSVATVATRLIVF